VQIGLVMEAPLALSTQTARFSAISLTRGIMVLSVLLSHWGPGLFERLGLSEAAEGVLSIAYRMGTPGFATVFGMGVGAFLLPGFAERRASALARMQKSLALVFAGMVFMALTQLMLTLLRGQPVDWQQISPCISQLALKSVPQADLPLDRFGQTSCKIQAPNPPDGDAAKPEEDGQHHGNADQIRYTRSVEQSLGTQNQPVEDKKRKRKNANRGQKFEQPSYWPGTASVGRDRRPEERGEAKNHAEVETPLPVIDPFRWG
jgi:hypothetical protein